ncbi:hypothetical protein RU97_GL002633 [Enterococcus canis]|uniref:DUF2922 domain-containing protein n=1 Tax=Enterococcus canis TaxID=214095 RepID=A0A1L8RCP9_9ENTE|nr:DUF2922 domain-containing protein [Enterococcus canis]OJG17462.1 hypothetical protein RU97_GL002633 [Enterococcus canis]
MKKLKMTFMNAANKKHTLTPTLADPNLSAEVVRENMTALTALGIFEKDSIAQFQTVDSAKYVETITTELF